MNRKAKIQACLEPGIVGAHEARHTSKYSGSLRQNSAGRLPVKKEKRAVHALRVQQWLAAWDAVKFSPAQHRRKPQPYFYLLSLPAAELRSLCGIARRDAKSVVPRAADLGIQRQHEPERSEEIRRFVEYGFPWSTLSERKQKTGEFKNLRKPGWLPTAIVVNILQSTDIRDGRKVAEGDLVSVSDGTEPVVKLPYEKWIDGWKPQSLPPIEVIDGQHRLWAFDDAWPKEEFDLPLVAFHGLDVSWQAYLFWTINIKPKRINPSLAFDLYPLLRAEDWLSSTDDLSVYRETRSQELTEALWSLPESPWYDRINMLGEKENRWATQSAWIKSLTATLVRPWQGHRSRPGGLFGSRIEGTGEVLGWSRGQQAAFLIFAWSKLKQAVTDSSAAWAKSIRAERAQATDDAAFYSEVSLLTTDQGIRGFLHVLNDVCYVSAARLQMDTWRLEGAPAANDSSAVSKSMTALSKHALGHFIEALAKELSSFDWRTSASKSVTEEERRQKLVFRGSGGYKELRLQLLERLRDVEGDLGAAARKLL